MKLFLLSQNDNQEYDTYDSCVVCAENEEDAKSITPTGQTFKEPEDMPRMPFSYPYNNKDGTWAYKKSAITCKEIGTANDNQERGVIIASFNAG